MTARHAIAPNNGKGSGVNRSRLPSGVYGSTPAIATTVSTSISKGRLGREGRGTGEIGFGQAPVIGVAQVLVDQRHLAVRRRQSCHHEKPERLPDSIPVQPVPADLVQGDDRIVRIDEIESHLYCVSRTEYNICRNVFS